MNINYIVCFTLKSGYSYKIDCGESLNIASTVAYNHLKQEHINVYIIPELKEDSDLDIIDI